MFVEARVIGMVNEYENLLLVRVTDIILILIVRKVRINYDTVNGT